MLSHDRATMRYQTPFAFTPDAREGLPHGAPRRSPQSLREYLGLQRGHPQGAQYPLVRDRGDLGNTTDLRCNLGGGGGDSDDLVSVARGNLRGREDSTDIAGALRGILRNHGNPCDMTAGPRGRGEMAQRAAEILRGRGQAQLAAELRDRGQAADLAAELREQPARPQREPSYDHPHCSDRQSNWLDDFTARNRAARRTSLDELLAVAYARRHDADHEYHCDHLVHNDNHDCHDHDYSHDYNQKKKCCGCSDVAPKEEAIEEKKKHAFKTKDVTLRGKSYQIRKSLLVDLGKFENELVKFVDKKSEEELPERVLQLLVFFINDETCVSQTALDLVGLNILASNLGHKSAVGASLQQLKSLDSQYPIKMDDLAKICGTITMSGKVDKGLESWLKKYLRDNDIFHLLENSRSFRVLVANHPEVYRRLEIIMGWRDNENALGLMII